MIAKEREIKLDLSSKENYHKLLNYFTGPGQERVLENHFFDTEDWALSKASWALRIRKEENGATITAKGVAERDTGGLTIRPEIEQDIPVDAVSILVTRGINFADLPEKLAGILEDKIAGKRLTEKVSFTTHRTVAHYESAEKSLVFEIDRTLFSDGSVDYELEVELDDKSQFHAAMRVIMMIFGQLKIKVSYQKDSKFARALRRLGLENCATG